MMRSIAGYMAGGRVGGRGGGFDDSPHFGRHGKYQNWEYYGGRFDTDFFPRKYFDCSGDLGSLYDGRFEGNDGCLPYAKIHNDFYSVRNHSAKKRDS